MLELSPCLQNSTLLQPRKSAGKGPKNFTSKGPRSCRGEQQRRAKVHTVLASGGGPIQQTVLQKFPRWSLARLEGFADGYVAEDDQEMLMIFGPLRARRGAEGSRTTRGGCAGCPTSGATGSPSTR